MSAFRAGLRAMGTHRRLVIGLWLTSVLVAAPFAVAIRDSLEDSIGRSLVHESMWNGFDMAWHGEYESDAHGIETSFRPSIAGGGAFLDNAEAWLTGELFDEDPLLVGAGALFALLWTFLLGGVLDRLARPLAERSAGGFARACGAYFPRFLVLAIVSGALYYGVYRLAGWLMARLERWTRDWTVERDVLLASAAAWCVIGLLLVVVFVWFALAKIALVTGDSQGVLGALGRGAGRLVMHPFRTLGTYLVFAALSAALVALYVKVAPMAGPASVPGLLAAFALGQALLVAKIGLRVGVLGALISRDQQPG